MFELVYAEMTTFNITIVKSNVCGILTLKYHILFEKQVTLILITLIKPYVLLYGTEENINYFLSNFLSSNLIVSTFIICV